jgi:hypothetical protein
VQRRVNKLKTANKDEKLEDRLRYVNLTTSETRRLRGDLIEVFEIFKESDDLYPDTFFELSQANIRGHSLKLRKSRCRVDIRKLSFAHRVIDIWNSLGGSIIACDSINRFKNRIDKFSHGRGFI